ncbi:SepM family pheromone-processing serine protease [Salisediminibacterium halotolerans]|uniref:SepM family pheromone-processing serine protease n=1 Tax=Salisediminibacterium halotolerans TaxID=517425 RepID=UPI000EB2282A|nr:SepM family pheromone-processing serine protease [Salisediminibacterium halotolerans]RLJ74323.1 PDZ domain-containing protein [Actinophytocola xinjiangensis]RPE87584.1 PDZ domain-containing protein [Salisediminibacterium halotolerans]TWG35160.1 PDZ domain-containing protein [Salisediminibacterium halotolerans]GEL08629.1 hypothetical protein SHA02_20450 [Salisediminibacterium halotolerans]
MDKYERPARNRSWLKWFLLFAVLIAVNFIQLPYYFTVPGDAKTLNEVIEVEDGSEYEGSFMLTTIRMGQANTVNYIWSFFSDERELLHENEVRPEGESDEDYHHRQMMMMDGSQETAIVVAFNYTDIDAEFENHGVLVTQIIEGMDAEEKLESGDRIIEIENEEIINVENMMSILADYEIGDEIALTLERGENRDNSEEVSLDITIEAFPEEMAAGSGEGGLGIMYPVTDRELVTDRDIHIDSEDIGGPSAGLMFSLEIYNQLTEDDVTKGRHIAGTGSITEDGEVGQIGGTHQKVYAADNAGADAFFAPSGNGEAGSNYSIAVETAEKIGTDMDIVAIDTFEDALDYLDSL